MPQHLKIKVEGRLVGWLSTGNKGGTLYDVNLRVPDLETDISLTDVDTGVQRQPQDTEARLEDFRDDFIHIRRCIAAAVASADNFLQQLQDHITPEYVEMKPITMQLMTNNFDRGFIQVHPSGNESVTVDVLIGVGSNRVPDSLPKDECKLAWEGINLSGATSHIERVLIILRSIGPMLLQELSERSPLKPSNL